MSGLARWVGRANRRIDATGDLRAMAVLRILLGPIVLLHLRPFLEAARDGVIYSDRFYLPYADWYPEASRAVYEPLLWAAGVSAVAMSLGVLSRLATAYTAAFVGYNLFLSKTHFAHNRAFLLILLVTVALLPVGRHYSVDALVRRLRRRPPPPPAPLWPIWLVRFEVVAVYLASGVSKAIDRDWWSGRVLQLRAIDNRQLGIDEGAPAWILDLLADGTFQWWFSKAAVLTEVFIGLGLVHRRTRLAAIWVAIPFHLAIQVGARVQVFSWAALAALVIWVTPSAGDRDLVVPRGHRFGRLVRSLDWFGRFHVAGDDGQAIVLLDRPRGSRVPLTRRDEDAVWTALSRLPATFAVAGPVVLVRRLRRWRSR